MLQVILHSRCVRNLTFYKDEGVEFAGSRPSRPDRNSCAELTPLGSSAVDNRRRVITDFTIRTNVLPIDALRFHPVWNRRHLTASFRLADCLVLTWFSKKHIICLS